jgi:hypothetical protein
VEQAKDAGVEKDEDANQFVRHMMDEGASPDAARQAAVGFFKLESERVPQGQLLPGWPALRWQQAMFVMLGAFLAVLVSVLFTAPAFHPTESASESQLWVTLFLVTFFPVLLLMFVFGLAMFVKVTREIRGGYTTLRWLTENPAEVRDMHGGVIPAGDKRLTSSARYMHSFILVGSACAIVSPAVWLLRVVIN